MTEPNSWDVLDSSERQYFADLEDREFPVDGEPTVQVINVGVTSLSERLLTMLVFLVLLVATWGTLGAISWAIWRVFQQ